MIMISSVLWGFLAAKRLSDRATRLRTLELLLTEIETQIKFCAKSLPQIFEQLKLQARFNNLDFLKSLELQRECFSESFKTALIKDCYLTQSERMPLLALADTLGSTDIEGQAAAIDIAKKSIVSQYYAEKEENLQKRRLYLSMGVLVGAALAVLMI